MKQKKSISAPKKGMNRDSNISQNENIEYIFALNADTNNEQGEGFNIQNEPSNTLGVTFPPGYKVIGFKNDILTNKTYYFLTNTETYKSSIGFVENTVIDTFNQDNESQCEDCSEYNQLSEPLENTTQVDSLEYTPILNDNCLDVGAGFNFNINFPIKKVEIKQEKLGTTLYWDDNRNPSRYLNVTDTTYLFTQQVPCEDDVQVDCILIDKLLVFPKHNKIRIKAEEQQTGGSLKLGTYEFYACYCDLLGNELTQYSTPVNPISIFDQNNNILTQNELDVYTNFAIKLKIEDLDSQNFQYYKVVCIERNNVDNTQSGFVEGIHPTTDNTVLYTSSGSSSDDFITTGNVSIKRRIDFNTLNLIKPFYDKAESTMSSGGRLFHKGLTKREEINLQPVVNLFSSLLQWGTSVSKKDLYKSSIATSNYKGFMRNEVQPFGLRFFYKDGDYSAVSTMVARPSNENDRLTVTDINYQSLNANTPDCTTNPRNKRWQIYNTAEITDTCNPLEEGTISLPETISKVCTIKEVFTIPSGSTTIPFSEYYTNLKDYIAENPNETIPGISGYIAAEYPQHCSPSFISTCDTPVLEDSYNIINTVLNEQTQNIPKTDNEYQKSNPPQFCQQYKIDTTNGGFLRDTLFEDVYVNCDQNGNGRKTVYFRESNFYNEDCAYATSVPDNLSTGGSIFLNYLGAEDIADLLQTQDVFLSDTYFQNKLHKKAQFFKVSKNSRDKIVLEITKNTVCPNNGDSLGDIPKIRYTIFDDCTAFTVLGGDIINTTDGVLLTIDTSTYPTEFIIAIDSPILTEAVDNNCPNASSTTVLHKINPPCGCFSILTRDAEYDSIVVTWDGVKLDKVEEYTSNCTFTVPKVDDCDPKPYVKGDFSYWQSTEEYPNNKQLFDSSGLSITQSDLNLLSPDDKLKFENYFTTGVNLEGNYTLKEDTNLTCKPIRHYKFPDNTLAPFMYDQEGLQKFSDTIIFPLGITVHPEVIRTMLRVALSNNLITQKEFDNIEGYEILRGDNSIHKSVIANGLAFDMYNYTKENNEKWWYANFPFNDLGADKFNTTDGVTLIQHPYDSNRNHMFSFLSPDLYLTRPALPTEVVLQGYQMGSARQTIANVEEHPKFTILGKQARDLATTLALLEAALDIAIKTTEFVTQGATGNLWFVAGVGSTGGNAIGVGISAGAIFTYAGLAAAQNFIKVGSYRYQWLKTFRDLGVAYNFAAMTVGVGEYNRFLKVDRYSPDYIRGLTKRKYLKDGIYSTVDIKDNTKININNDLREESVLLSTGENYKFNYPEQYSSFDNNNVNSNSSTAIASDYDINKKINLTVTRDIASPYFSLKNYIPDQWGTVDSIKWLTTNNVFKLEEDTDCKNMFGGTVCISPFSVRKKTPIFRTTAMGLPDKLPFNYSNYNNIGFPKYYIDYEVDSLYKGTGLPFPDIDSRYNLDCAEGTRGFYVKPPSKIYLYSYGIVNFLVESEINCHFRYAKKESFNNFYPQVSNVVDWVQEKNMKIAEPNTFFYNNTYSFPVSNTPYKFLDRTYDKEIWRKRYIQPNAAIYSEQDVNEADLTDPWLVYKPLNWNDFGTTLGKLIDLKDIESQQYLARFENGYRVFNSIDNLADRILPQNKETGTSGLFAARPMEIKTTELGFAGTQNTEICSTPFGHFWADAKRGRFFQVDQNGKSLEVISETVGGKPTNMEQWFKENIPFKILKYLPTIDIDNKFRGLGINMWWDDRKSRLFITKRDYVLVDGINKEDFTIDPDTLELYYGEEEQLVRFDNDKIFKDVSWTISFKPKEGSWSSYYSFYPDYSPFHNNYFQVGYNWGDYTGTTWNHMLNNSSFQVFQGILNPFVVKYPIQNENILKQLDSMSFKIESRRYQNNWDFSLWKDISFSNFSVYTNTKHTGILNMFPQKSLTDSSRYPKTNTNNTQDVLFTAIDEKHNVNYFFNRVINQQRNIPIHLKDENNIFETVNPRAVAFKGKNTLERMTGETMVVRLENNKESRFNILLKNTINSETILE